jgi:hypothetical protein
MPPLANPFVIVNPYRRRGAAMLITMLVTTAVVAVLFMASERTRANSIMTDLGDDRLRASLAAESVAALVEAKLVSRAAEVENLTSNVHDDPATWWNLAGCSYTVGTSPVIPARGLWVDGCVVRWRIEPVKIASAVGPDGIADDATYTVNRETSAERVEDRERDARAGGGGMLLEGNPPYFHYRIVAEAYALKDPDQTTAVPWAEAGHHTVSVQVQRVVQLNLVNLFDYAIFYGASGETGDLELEPEIDTRINASLHSNGAIYLGGAGKDFKSKNYKKAASDGGAITLGGRSDKVQVSGVMGVYRLRKAANIYFASPAGNGEPTVKSPRDVPLSGKKVKQSRKLSIMSGTLDLNGGDGDPATEKVSLNGEKFTYQLDSRRDWSLPENRFDPYITDAKSGGTAITTLANIPHFSGHPLETQRLVGEQTPLYRTVDDQRFTIDPTREPARLLYYNASGALTTDPAEGVRPAYATDMPLFRFVQAGHTHVDVWPNQPIAPTSTTLAPAADGPAIDAPVGATPPERTHTWLPSAPAPGTPGAMLGYYLEKSLFGEPEATTTGLTIRERGRQNPAFRFATDGSEIEGALSPAPPERADFATPAAHVRALVAWLKSNYAVYLGRDAAGKPQDITDAFFDFGAAAAEASGDINQLVASQGHFVNRREARWLQDNGYFSAATVSGPSGEDSARTLRARPFTLHLARVCEFLRTANPLFAGTAPNQRFNGLIYLHRTPRLGQVTGNPDVHEPLAPLRYNPVSDPDPLAPDAISNRACDFLKLGSSTPGAVPAVGSPGSWAVYPLHLPVRITQADAIDTGPLPSGRPGLTLITPDACYVQGSFNTTSTGGGDLPPCALFADSLTLLSSRWSDAENDQHEDYDGPLPLAADTQLNLSLVLNNLPTDETTVLDGGSGGVHNLVRYLEDWSGRTMRLRGSVVVLNRMRYSSSLLGESLSQRAPKPLLDPQPGLFGSGHAPFAPVGIKVTRMITTLADVH